MRQAVSVIEIVSRLLALEGMKVGEATASAVENMADLRIFAQKLKVADIDDRYASGRSEEEYGKECYGVANTVEFRAN